MHSVMRALASGAERDGVAGGRSGGVAIVQRFGGALNLNIHIHALVLDGVFVPGPGGPRFHPVGIADLDVEEVLATVQARIARLLVRRGLTDESEGGDAWARVPPLDGLASASVRGLQGIGPARGRRVRRLGDALEVEPDASRVSVGPLHARAGGFDLHAAVRVPAGRRDHLESVCRYALRPPVAGGRIRLTQAGDVLLELRHRWADGTTHLVFDPVEFLGRLAVLVPRPRINLLFYYGVLGARAAGRRPIVPAVASGGGGEQAAGGPQASGRAYLWAELMRRTFGFDVLACPRCGGRLRLIALIEERAVIARILAHLGVPGDVPDARPSRPPPLVHADLDFA